MGQGDDHALQPPARVMMEPFVYEALPTRVVFGSGTVARIRDEVERLGVRRVLVLSTPGRGEDLANEISSLLGALSVGVHAGAVMHTPVDATEMALSVVRERATDGLVAVGGGSTTGLGKAIALRTDLPQVVLPTTYAGSEMTPILGETSGGTKTTQRSLQVLPEVVIYDVDLTLGLPAAISGTSGMNAIAHAVEALYTVDRNPVISLLAEDGIAALARALPRISEAPQDRVARSDALYGAWLCGTCLGAVSMALHHKLCHVLGGAFDPPQALYKLAGRLGAKQSLRELGMPQDGIEQAVEQTMATPYPNPRPLGVSAIRELIIRSWEGDPPYSN